MLRVPMISNSINELSDQTWVHIIMELNCMSLPMKLNNCKLGLNDSRLRLSPVNIYPRNILDHLLKIFFMIWLFQFFGPSLVISLRSSSIRSLEMLSTKRVLRKHSEVVAHLAMSWMQVTQWQLNALVLPFFYNFMCKQRRLA